MTAQLAPLVDGGRFEYGQRTAVELIVAHALRHPTDLAVRQWDSRLDYGTLVATAARLADTLRERGVGPESLVGVCLRRRPSMVVGVLGVLLAGGAYVPLDPDAPARRREQVAADAGLTVIVVDAETAPLFADAADVDSHPYRRSDGPETSIRRRDALVRVPEVTGGVPVAGAVAGAAGLDNAAYVLHTSGSTGRPKGVVVSHRSLVAHVLAFGAVTGVDRDTRGFGFTHLGFDVSVQDIFAPLVAGGSVALTREEDRGDLERLQRFATEHRVNWGFVPPAVLPLLDPSLLPDWRLVYTGAEAPGPEQVARWTASHGRRFVNAYGPTEATVCVTSIEASGHWDEPVPIGRPLPNHRLVVVDDELRPLGPGEPGELLIGGVGLARGYLADPALTAERFLPDPFGAEPGQRLYRTGDRVQWLPDGNLRFLGRVDRQVKIRGQRVEPGELEAVLRGHPRVRHAVVQVVDGRLVAFCTVADAPVTADELVAHAAQLLPTPLVPSRVLLLASMPLTTSGKVDGAALTALASSDPGVGVGTGPDAGSGSGSGLGDADRPAPGAVLPELWATVLDRPVSRVRLADDFFAAGGHSVAAMRLVAAIRSRLRRDVTAEDVFAGRTLGGLTSRVDAASPLPGSGLTTGNPPTLSASQRRLWFLDKLAPDSAAYNVAFAERLIGPLDVDALRAALTAVATRHEVLRWRIPDTAGVPHPVCDPPAEVPLPVVDLMAPGFSTSSTASTSSTDNADTRCRNTGHAAEQELRLTARLAADAATVFDLATGPVWRAVLYRLGPDDHALSIAAHHAVSDGWSQAVLYRDLAAAYAAALPSAGGVDTGGGLAPLPAAFGDYAVWRAECDRRDGERDLRWWTEHLAGAPTVLDLPRDRERPAVQTYAGALVSAAFTPELDGAVRGLAATLGATPSSVLLAGLGELLRRLTGDASTGDVVIGAIVADRRLAETEDMVGFFVDIVPVRLRSDAAAGFADATRRCLTELLDVTAHPAAPLDRIVNALGVRRDPTRSPLVQMLFNVFNFAEPTLALPGCTAHTLRVPMPGSPFDLTVYLVERDGRFAVDVVYNPDLYDAARMDALLTDYLALLGALVGSDGPCGDVALRLTSPTGLVSRNWCSSTSNHSPGAPAPITATERLVAGVWAEVLGRPVERAVDNFFDVGGDSMAMVAVQARLAGLIGRELAVVDLFRHSNVRALAAFIDAADDPDAGDGAPDAATAGLARAAQRAAARRARPRRARPPVAVQPIQAAQPIQPIQAVRTIPAIPATTADLGAGLVHETTPAHETN